MKRWLVLALALVFALTMGGVPDVSAQATKDATKSDKAADKKKGPMDLNAASAEDLHTLPGLGEAYSKKIIENRPYKRKDQIVARQAAADKKADKAADKKK